VSLVPCRWELDGPMSAVPAQSLVMRTTRAAQNSEPR
jgi:hypothetical protein